MSLDEEFAARNPRSRELFLRQRQVVPGGVTHVGRGLEPFPLFVESVAGGRKRDVDGNEYIDYWCGHGALLLGHGHPAVTRAVSSQLERGTHAGGETELGLQWAELIKELVPSAGMVRFTSSGGEANQLALWVARVATGRDRVVRFEHGFHGWFDAGSTAILPAGDLLALERVLAADPDIGAVLLEPAGVSSELVPNSPEFLQGLRELCSARGVLLIFDEVVTGFRWSRGGAQAFFGVIPDLTTLGKVMGGGLPAGAVAGRADLMAVLDGRIAQTGTWNAMPIVAAAGVAALREVRDGDHVDRARRLAVRLIDGFNAVFAELGVKGFAYGRSSLVRLGRDPERLIEGWGPLAGDIRKAMLLEGVDLMRVQAFVSSAHSEEDVDLTVQALERALGRLRREGRLGE